MTLPLTARRNSSIVITDLTVSFESTPSSTYSNSTFKTTDWHRIEKDLYLHALAGQTAWLHIAQAKQEDLTSSHLVVTGVRIGEPALGTDIKHTWESRPAGLWVRRSNYTGDLQNVVTGVDVLFGTDAVDPRMQWSLLREPLQLKNGSPRIPIARPTIRRGWHKPSSERPTLRAQDDGSFRIVQISDTHMVTGVGCCNDAIDADGQPLPESEADPLTAKFMGALLDAEKPDLVVLTGDQLHHDILDSQTALFKVVAPVIERSIPWVAVFGNHDSEGNFALSRKRSIPHLPSVCCQRRRTNSTAGLSQMALYQELPFSLCESGPEDVYGVGNYYLQVFDKISSTASVATLYLLDSHGQINARTSNPDYEAIQPDQIDWFTNTSQMLREERENQVSQESSEHHDLSHISLVFFHIPLPEFADDDRIIRTGGQRREPTEGPSINTHFYNALVEADVAAVGCGHDHVNDFCARLKGSGGEARHGPWLCYNGGSGYGGYCSYGENRYHRRARVWDLNSHRGSLKTWKRMEYHDQRIDQLSLVAHGESEAPDPPANANLAEAHVSL
jgi:3',5'-cyclic AMP phosphodiesterase CpdA